DRDLAGNLDAVFDDTHIFPRTNLLRLVGELLVVLQTLLGIPEVVLERALAIIFRQSRHAVAVKEAQIVQVGSIGERVLCEDYMALAFGSFIEQGWNEATGISAADIDHSGSKRAEHGVSIVEKFLGRPIVRGISDALSFDDRSPGRAIPGRVSSILALFPKRFVNRFHLLITACFRRVEEALEFMGDSDFEMLGHGVCELAAAASELRDFVAYDFRRRGPRLNNRPRLRQTGAARDFTVSGWNRLWVVPGNCPRGIFVLAG